MQALDCRVFLLCGNPPIVPTALCRRPTHIESPGSKPPFAAELQEDIDIELVRGLWR